jgi:hypothetical protein
VAGGGVWLSSETRQPTLLVLPGKRTATLSSPNSLGPTTSPLPPYSSLSPFESVSLAPLQYKCSFTLKPPASVVGGGVWLRLVTRQPTF